LSDHIEKLIQQKTRAKTIEFDSTLQSLWSGYGSIDRYTLSGCETPGVIVKHIRPPEAKRHPRGWDTNLSHQRKLKSYQVETYWYRHYAQECDEHCRIPAIIAIKQHGDETVIIMEDLDASGFPVRKQSLDLQEMKTCLNWLAAFHARFMKHKPKGLWTIGSYWHLNTRPDEHKAMPDGPLKENAARIDQLLNSAPYKTFVHGDAKLANFCFPTGGERVAAVDFQYVGGGNGMKDIAYFISSCLDENECAHFDQSLLDIYFDYLQQHLARYQPDIDADQVEKSWRPLYEIAWTDFFRFLQGWSPGHWKIHRYSQDIADKVISRL
jgi:thiamine kinase-like enzyme